MSLRHVSPAEAKALIAQGAVLVDIREADEHARQRIAGARHAPLSKGASIGGDTPGIAIFHCRTGARTAGAAADLAAAADGACEMFVLDGGLEAWRAAGLPVVEDRGQPIEIMRQVQIAAGGLALIGFALGATVHPGFHALSGAIGAGLLFAGLSGWCGLARLLILAPWNRRTAAKPAAAAAG